MQFPVKNNFLSGLVAAIVLVALSWCANIAVAEDEIILKKTKWFPICQEIHEILQLPENKGYIKPLPPYIDVETLSKYKAPTLPKGLFHIPASFTNFRLPKWEIVTLEEEKDVLPKSYAGHLKGGRILGRDYILEKTVVDIDHDGYKDEVYRIIPSSKDRQNGLMMRQDDDDVIHKGFNEHLGFHPEELFFYKGRAYVSKRFTSDTLSIYEPKRIGPREEIPYAHRDFFPNKVCIFEAQQRKE